MYCILVTFFFAFRFSIMKLWHKQLDSESSLLTDEFKYVVYNLKQKSYLTEVVKLKWTKKSLITISLVIRTCSFNKHA